MTNNLACDALIGIDKERLLAQMRPHITGTSDEYEDSLGVALDGIFISLAAQGFVIVPTVATPEMVEAGWMARGPRESLEANSIATWTAMIATSPAQGD